MITCDPSTVTLTPREKQILALIAQGLSNKTIAEVLHMATSTVKHRVGIIHDKVGARHNRASKRCMLARIYLLSWAWCEFPREQWS